MIGWGCGWGISCSRYGYKEESIQVGEGMWLEASVSEDLVELGDLQKLTVGFF